MSKKHKKFRDTWASQSQLGSHYGLPAIAVGKELIKAGLKDSETKQPTSNALSSGYAISTPLKDGTPFFMWNMKKVNAILSSDHQKLTATEFHVRNVQKALKNAERMANEGQDKLAYIYLDSVYDDVPKEIREKVRRIVEGDVDGESG